MALCGVFGALSVGFMLLGSVLPLSTYLAPALAGVLLAPVAFEFGAPTGVLAAAAVGLLSVFTVPDKEMALMFVFFLGWYPIVKTKLDKLRNKVVQWCTKFALFNVCILGMYAVVLFLFPIPALVNEFSEMGLAFAGALLAGGNLTFLLYDVALTRFYRLYWNVWRSRLMGLH